MTNDAAARDMPGGPDEAAPRARPDGPRPVRRTDPERFDSYTRWSVYCLLATVPLLALAVVSGLGVEAYDLVPVFGLASLPLTALAIVVFAQALTAFLGGRPVRRGWLAGVLVVSAGMAALAVLLPVTDGLDGRAGGVTLALGVPLVACAPLLSWTWTVGGGLAVGAATAAAVWAGAGADGRAVVPAGVSAALIAGGMALSSRTSAWMLWVVREQERTRAVHARLAVAEERLRFSRDLHDVVGRAMSAIAVKSELAAELARRGQHGAVVQMEEVRDLAQETLAEVRGVVAGYRGADLAAELEGARSVLRSAGVGTRVVGAGASLPDAVQEALAWVVREAVTNVVRHAHATRCTIDLAVDGSARLTIRNDGVAHPRRHGGSGLLGLAERLAAVGGELTTDLAGGMFTVAATVPLGARMGAR